MTSKWIISFTLLFLIIYRVASMCEFGKSNFIKEQMRNHPIIYKYKSDGTPITHYPRVDKNFDCFYDSGDEKIHLACPGDRPGSAPKMQFHQYTKTGWTISNKTSSSVYIMQSSSSPAGLRVHGDKEGLFTADAENFVTCTSDPYTAMLNTTKSFRPTEETYLVGITLNDFDLLKVYEYAELFESKWKVTHVRIPSIINESPKSVDNWYERGLLYRNKKLNFGELYSKEYQMAAFQKHFKNRELAQKYFSGSNSLVIGQLISLFDMFYYYEQKSTLYYDVTAPIWESVYDGNWEYIGKLIRKLADETGRDLDVFAVSVMGFRINNSAEWLLGNSTDSPDTLAVPQLLVKAAIDVENRARGMVFHTFNDPHLDPKTVPAQLADYCTKTTDCKKRHPEFANVHRGYTFCCTPEDSYVLKEMLMLKWI